MNRQPKTRKFFFNPALERLEPRLLLSGQPMISELMAVNSTTLADEDGAYSDWLEIHNPDAAAVDLTGWKLKDGGNEWVFPGMSLGPGEFRVIFASGNDRRDPAGELHTNFSLKGSGEYLGLLDETGAVVHEYDEYPEQTADISYGIAQDIETTQFVATGDTAAYLIPDADPGAWTALGFDDTDWPAGQSALGYADTVDGFAVWNYKANTSVGHLDTALQVLANSGMQSYVNSENAPFVNYYNSGGNGHYTAGQVDFPGFTGLMDDFVVEAKAFVTIPSAGEWSFGVNSDDGFSLTVTGAVTTAVGNSDIPAGSDTITYAAPRGTADTIGVFDFPAAGTYEIRSVMYERGGGSAFEIFAAPGAHTSFSAADFDLVGDTANGGLAVVSEPVTGGGGGSLFASLIETDLEDQMKGVNASAYLRFPFTVVDPAQLESLTLKMKYDDGYAAYLNGTEVARKNADDPLSWNSAATADRSDTQATTWENVDLTAYLPLLNADNGSGAEDNVLAVHAMNYAADDGDFLILPELSQSVYMGLGEHFFAIATPADVNSEEYWLYVEDTSFSHDRGFYEAPFDLEITTDTVGADIYYTTDGSQPTEAGGTLYTTPIRIATTTAVRAAAFKAAWAPTNVDTQTYLFLDNVANQPGDPAGFPASWNGTTADYEMDPDVVDDPLYSDLLNDALRSIPTISIVANVDDLFGDNGIYSNPGGQGTAWERVSSVEWINTDGSTGFQVDAGLRIYGGAFRGMNLTRKKTFRLLFKAQYGPTKLNFPMFGEDGAASSFDNLVLRGGANDAWNNWGKQNTQYIVDEYMRRLQLDLGEPSGHGTFVHLYLNGLYWGLYNPIERPEASFDATYFGGEKEEWDGINAGAPTGESNTVTWNAMFDQVRAGLADNESYQKIQGNSVDGTDDPAYDDLLDVENYIAYMFSNFWGGTGDWPGHNYYAGARRPPNDTGFKFFNWDAEGAIVVWSNLNADRTGVNSGAGEPYAAIRQNPEFRMLFADFVHRYMFNDGPGTAGPSLARYQELADEVELAIIAESARWGDQASDTPYTLEHWRNTRDYVLNTYMPQRPQIVLNQMKAAGFYPDVVAPSFSINASHQHGGTIDPGDSLTIGAPAGTVYYTTNGSDPRELYGAISPGALVYSGAIGLTEGTHVKARAYDNGEWSALNEATYCIDLAPAIRITEVMYNPAAAAAAEIAAGFADNDMFEFIELRNTGSKTLPLEGLRLSDGVEFTFPRISLAPGDYVVVVANQAAFQHRYSGFGGTIAGQFDSGTLNNAGERIQLDAPIGGVIHEFTFKDGWFGHTDGEGFSLNVRSDLQDLPLWDTKEGWQPSSTPGGTPGAGDTDLAPGSIVINEILAHSNTPLVDMIELHNTTGAAIDVSGWFLSDAKTDDVGNPTLTKYQLPSLPPIAAGNYLLLREDTHFGSAFSLSELGDDVYLSKNAGSEPGGYREHVDFGASPSNTSFGVFVKSTGGTDFTLLAGPSFGSANAAPYMDALAFNELQYHPAAVSDAEIAAGFTNADDFEFIEIRNTSGSTRTLSDFYVGGGVGFTFGWYDADSAGNESWTLEAGATATWNAILPAGQDTYEVFARWDVLDGEGHERNLDGRASYAVTHAGGTTTVIRDQQPDPQEEGPTYMDEFGWVSLGNYVFNGSGQVVVTRGTNNPANWTIADQVRFVSDSHTEIVDDPSLDSWNTANGPAAIGPGEYVVLVSNRTAFEARYGAAGSGIPLAGQYTGNLDNGGEKVKLFRRGNAEPTGFIPYYRVDYVNYDDNLPWPGEPDGSGSSLNRVNADEYGNDPVNWQAGAVPGTPGADNVFVDSTPPTVPTGLDYALVAEPGYRIDLTWTASADPGSFVDHYVIYRDGMPHDTSPTNSYSDTDVALGGSWDYRVSAVNRDQIESDRSTQRHASIMDVVSAVGLNYTTIQVVLTETLDETSAETAANYALTDPVGQPVGIASAALEADGVTVTLTPSTALAGDTPYLLDVAGVRDFAGNPVPPGMRAEIVLSASPVFIPAGSEWKYLDDGSDQGTAWKEASFPAESTWASGHAQLGYGDGGEQTLLSYGGDSSNKFITTYFRTSFEVADASLVTDLTAWLVRDDGAAVYVNGNRAFTSNFSADPFDYLTRADGAIGGGAESTFYEYAVDPAFLVDGTNVLAVELHQANPTSSDISFDLELVATVQFTRPTPTDDGYSTDRNTTLNVDAGTGLLANDVDPEPGPQPLTAVLVDDVEHGQLTVHDDGSFQFVPAPGYAGADSFTYRAHDGQWYSNLATVDLTVINNDTTSPMADITDVSPDPINSAVAEIGIVFTEWVDGLGLDDLVLTHDGGPDLLTPAQTLTTTDNVTWTLGNLAGITAADGDYALTLAAAGAGIVDGAGNALAADATETWAMDATAPTVEAVLVNATAWGQSFLDELGEAGYAVPAGADQLDELPWNNLDQVIVVFSEETTVEQEDLVLYGVAVPEYAVTGFGYDEDTLTATWTFAAAAQADKLLVSLGDGVTDPAGNALDGEWVDTVSTYSSGDGSAGGDFRFRLNILPGDADQSGEVRSSDVIKVRRKGNTAPGNAEYSIFYDVDGSGEIRSSDVIKVRRLGNTQLPDGEPTILPPAAAGTGGALDAGLIAAAVDAAQREADSEASQSDTDPLDVLLLSQIVPLTL